LHKKRHEDDWNRIQYPDVNSCNYADLIFEKTPKTYHGKKIVSSANIAGKTASLPAEN
jgi:hypothetical protein